jgi:hypothetical protein
MNEYQKGLLDGYKNKVKCIGEKTAVELDCFLKKQEFIEVIDFYNDMDQSIQEYTIRNVVQSNRWGKFSPTIEKPSFLAYKVTNAGLGKEYYCSTNRDAYVAFCDGTKGIYLVIEKNTAAISGNSGQLVLEMLIERGIDAYDYENNTLTLFEYLSRIEALEKFFSD